LFNFLFNLWRNRKLLFDLVKNDFKQRYLGNMLGMAWAFIQPMATVLIFWFVFQVGFKSQPVDNFPFILWLVAGMFPWFYFSEGVAGGTNAILSNAFLVKKVVFRVALLPLIPLFSALVVHLFFIGVMVAMFLYYGYTPTLSWLQIPYYTIALTVLVLGITWITASVVVFFRDIGQLVTMFLQFGFWLTPIFWSEKIIPPAYHWVIQLNPLTYIVEGYRNSMIYHRWFWQDATGTLYYWGITAVIFLVGITTFRRLRPHFADVL